MDQQPLSNLKMRIKNENESHHVFVLEKSGAEMGRCYLRKDADELIRRLQLITMISNTGVADVNTTVSLADGALRSSEFFPQLLSQPNGFVMDMHD
jgi:hypothetical protein